jgi:hypothetical protein
MSPNHNPIAPRMGGGGSRLAASPGLGAPARKPGPDERDVLLRQRASGPGVALPFMV